ncbi:MAG TPA: hypothetical protein VKB45_13355 [Gemmatimonadales bacterium]|nr:hypothetical protein [Gemmatimonadales bacterium]
MTPPPTEEKRPRWLDAAVVITLVSIALYVLGWSYWAALLRRFGLSVDVVGLNFEQVLSSTWPLTVVFAIMLPVVFIRGWENVSRLVVFCCGGIGGSLFTLLRATGHPLWQCAGALLVLAVVGAPLAFLVRNWKIHSWGVWYLLVLGLAAPGFVAYVTSGMSSANKLARGRSGICVNVSTVNDPQPPPRLVLLARSSGLLFLTRPDTSGRNTGALIIPEATIRNATIENCAP